MTTPDPHAFAREWAAAWNAHDVEAVLRHFHDDVVFTSPVATRVLPESGGVLRGKDDLRRYWTEGLRLIPDLRFTVEAVSVGVSAIVITYRNQKDVLVNEVLIFDGALVREGHGTYPGDDPNPAGARG
ncbi:nuclear transport factor 2 family protein [Jiangella rhizosphaerae]|uniref:Nuclear transport factor 2 family protein n=1 Tax=Jiangella rhizosphaerae TaxID=2293569 RepID=A0A418KQZ1_9ACTN|nr:nuclear transport factor 2 family protein [Jiangella rhizosphaerae]RIQ22784.1 nuclear transport factor 2 family protein [Jiangella rhizosphaerae]